MPIFLLNNENIFPPPEWATKEGILAIGGDLSSERLLEAYRNGIFPWYSERDPIIWWSPNPRLILQPPVPHISKSMKRLINRSPFVVTFDRDFREVIANCRYQRENREGTWITGEMVEAYCRLHGLGFAHSVEVWQQERMVGGLYGVSLGKCFFGESMFHIAQNASKFAFIKLAQKLREWGFLMIDCQTSTPHLKSLGAREIPRTEFQKKLRECLKYDTHREKWIYDKKQEGINKRD